MVLIDARFLSRCETSTLSGIADRLRDRLFVDGVVEPRLHFLVDGRTYRLSKTTQFIAELPREQVHEFYSVDLAGATEEGAEWRRVASKLILETMIRCIGPEVLVVCQESTKEPQFLDLEVSEDFPVPRIDLDEFLASTGDLRASHTPSKDIRLVDQVIANLILGDHGHFSHSILSDYQYLAIALARHEPRRGKRNLYVDITSLSVSDAQTGIQRVVRSVLAQLPKNIPADYTVQPVYGDESGRFKNATQWSLKNFGSHEGTQEGAHCSIDPRPGDIFLGLDFSAQLYPLYQGALDDLRACGVQVHFIVYDIIPLLKPHFFEPHMEPAFRQWLECVARSSNSLICISKSVADEVCTWLGENHGDHAKRPAVRWFHLGSDFSTKNIKKSDAHLDHLLLERIKLMPTFLMVGTLEPRKGHRLVLDAFEGLWSEGADCNLILVGKLGWEMNEVADRIRNCHQYGKLLFWPGNVSDDDLEYLYRNVSFLIASSEAEGFGLPLVEAGLRGLPVIASDIPVFREVAQGEVLFFESGSSMDLRRVIEDTLRMDRQKPHSKRVGTCKTWAESTSDLSKLLF